MLSRGVSLTTRFPSIVPNLRFFVPHNRMFGVRIQWGCTRNIRLQEAAIQSTVRYWYPSREPKFKRRLRLLLQLAPVGPQASHKILVV